MTVSDLARIETGTVLRCRFDTTFPWRTVAVSRVTYRGTDRHGRPFVHFYVLDHNDLEMAASATAEDDFTARTLELTDEGPDLESLALAAIRSAGRLAEAELIALFWPSPDLPADRSPEALEAWNARRRERDAAVYNGPNAHADRLTAACIQLRSRGLIRTHNNGLNSYSYEAVS